MKLTTQWLYDLLEYENANRIITWPPIIQYAQKEIKQEYYGTVTI